MVKKIPRSKGRGSPRRSNATKYDDVVSKIKDVGDLEMLIKSLWYGRSGTGKTTLAAWALPKPILFIDMKEEGTDSITDVKDCKVIPAGSWEELEQIYWYLESGNHPYKSVVLDTVTQMQELVKKHVLEEEGKEFASMQIRGKMNELMNTWIINYRDLPMNVAFLAQDRITEVDTEEEDQVIPEVGPQVSPGVAKTLNAAVKMIGHTYIQEVITKAPGKIDRRMEYRVRVGPHPYYLTKTRKPKKYQIPQYIVDPTYEDLIALMKGEYKAPSDKKKPSTKKPLRRK